MDKLTTSLSKYVFETDEDTILKTLAITLNIEPTADGMMQLKEFKSKELTKAMEVVYLTFKKLIKYLKEHLRVYSTEFIPYQGELLVLYKYSLNANTTVFTDRVMARWFISTSINEEITSRPESYTLKALATVDHLTETHAQDIFTPRVNIKPDELVSRLFRKGKALSTSIVNLFAIKGAKSIFTGQAIDPRIFMGPFDHRNYGYLVDKQIIEQNTKAKYKCLANLFIQDASYQTVLTGPEVLDFILSGNAEQEGLESQFITENMIHLLNEEDYGLFLQYRASNILAWANTYLDIES